jgi:hypothetical protein
MRVGDKTAQDFEFGNRFELNRKIPLEGWMHGDCPDCKRLSENLTEATKAYFAILEKSQLARSDNNAALAAELETLKQAAAEKRGKARQELRQHEATHRKTNGGTA